MKLAKRKRDADFDMISAYQNDPRAFANACDKALPARLDTIVHKIRGVSAKTVVIFAHSDLLLELTRHLGLREETDAHDPCGWEFGNAQVRVAAGFTLV